VLVVSMRSAALMAFSVLRELVQAKRFLGLTWAALALALLLGSTVRVLRVLVLRVLVSGQGPTVIFRVLT
jgi:hypothetical protein